MLPVHADTASYPILGFPVVTFPLRWNFPWWLIPLARGVECSQFAIFSDVDPSSRKIA